MSDEILLPSLILYEQSRMMLPTRPECIGAAAEYWCKKAILCGACPEKRSNKVTMALHEAISNAMVHGNLELSSALKEHGDASFAEELAHRAADPRLAARQVDVSFDYDGARGRWTIADQGRGFDYERILSGVASSDPEVLLASGRGILIMRSFMDSVAYEDGGRRLLLTIQCADERRMAERRPSARPIEVAPIRDGSPDWDAAVKTVATNISEHGMALVHEKLVSGEQIMISMQSGGKSFTVPAEIRHTRSLSGVLMEIGCRFLEEPRGPTPQSAKQTAAIQDVIAQLLATRQENPEHLRREYEREVFSECVDIFFGNSSVVGYTRDLSKGGVAFVATTELPSEVTLVFPPRGELPQIRMRAKVVRCTKIRDGLFDFGAKFEELLGG